MNKTKFTVDIPTPDLDKLREISKEKNLHIGQIINELIRKYLKGK